MSKNLWNPHNPFNETSKCPCDESEVVQVMTRSGNIPAKSLARFVVWNTTGMKSEDLVIAWRVFK